MVVLDSCPLEGFWNKMYLGKGAWLVLFQVVQNSDPNINFQNLLVEFTPCLKRNWCLNHNSPRGRCCKQARPSCPGRQRSLLLCTTCHCTPTIVEKGSSITSCKFFVTAKPFLFLAAGSQLLVWHRQSRKLATDDWSLQMIRFSAEQKI